MSVTKSAISVEWAGAATKSISSGGNATSDAFALSAAAVIAQAQLKADNDGTPASGDTVDIWMLYSLDGATYDTTNQAAFLCRLNTNGADPSTQTVTIPASWKNGKLYAVNNSAGRAITVSASIYQTVVS